MRIQQVLQLFLSIGLYIFAIQTGFAQEYTDKRIFILHSYDEKYPWTHGIHQAIFRVLEGKRIISQVFYMDTKNRSSEADKLGSAQAVKTQIEHFKPDVVIVSDDDAVKYVLMPYYKNNPIPFVFCGVNWDASEYGLPYSNATGMLEIELLDQIVRQVKENTRTNINRVGTLSLDGFTEHKRVDKYREHLGNNILNNSYFPNSFEEWKTNFLKLQSEVDMLFILNAKGLKGWDAQQAEKFVLDNIKIPTATATAWMSPMSLLGIMLVPEEQGMWAAETALKILAGQSPKNIPIVRNKEGNLFINFKIAEKLGVTFKPALLKRATIIR
jgi:ABC-type uncharacterized transport system substrate-binding protein